MASTVIWIVLVVSSKVAIPSGVTGTDWLPRGTVISRSVGREPPESPSVDRRRPLIVRGLSQVSVSVGRLSVPSAIHVVSGSPSTAASGPAAGSPATWVELVTRTPGSVTGVVPPSTGSTVPSIR